jgi:hypothetical protein
MSHVEAITMDKAGGEGQDRPKALQGHTGGLRGRGAMTHPTPRLECRSPLPHGPMPILPVSRRNNITYLGVMRYGY